MAMVHLAMHDAYVGITKEGDMYSTYDSEPPSTDDSSAHCSLESVNRLPQLSLTVFLPNACQRDNALLAGLPCGLTHDC